MEPIHVLCVDDSPDISEVLCRVIDATDGMKVVGSLSEADNLVDEVRRTLPHVVVIDLTMRGKDPLDAVRELSQAFPEVRIIAFSAHDDQRTIHQAWDAGAWAFASKNDPIDTVLGSIRAVAALSSHG